MSKDLDLTTKLSNASPLMYVTIKPIGLLDNNSRLYIKEMQIQTLFDLGKLKVNKTSKRTLQESKVSGSSSWQTLNTAQFLAKITQKLIHQPKQLESILKSNNNNNNKQSEES